MRNLMLSLGFIAAILGEGNMGNCSEVRIGPTGFLEKDGKPLFVIGAYSPPKGGDANVVASMGFNLLSIGADPKDWDACKEAGLFIWHTLGLDHSGADVAAKEAALTERVAKFKDHPNLLIWESTDEPAWSDEAPEKPRYSAEALTKGYRFLKTLDGAHPVYLNHAPRNTVETLRKYNSAADILCVDVYPVMPPNLKKSYAIIPPGGVSRIARQTDMPDLSPACVGDYVDKMKQVAYEGMPVFVVLQGFAWEALNPEAQRDPALVVYPNLQELRFMAYQAIVHGANGLTVWGLSHNDNQAYLADLSAVLNEVRAMEPFILGWRYRDQPARRYRERGSSITKGVECLITETDGAVTLFAVNASVDPATVQFSALPASFDGIAELEVLNENRKVKVDQGAFEEDFGGLGVHVYQGRRGD